MFTNHVTNDELTRLLRKFAAQDSAQPELRSAQRLFFNYLNRELDQHVRRIVNYNEDIAQVAMQEAWIKIFNSANKYDPAKASVKTWVKMITFNCAIDELRLYYKRQKLEDFSSPNNQDDGKDKPDAINGYVDDVNNPVCPLLHPDELVYADQLQQAIKACIELLPTDGGPNFRQAMELCLDEDLGYAEMTTILAGQSLQHAHINVEQVRGWVRHAKLRMQTCISRKLGLGTTGALHE